MPKSQDNKCGLCLEDLEVDGWEAFSCGVHKACTDCAARWTRQRLEEGKLPNCCQCEKPTDPLLAIRLLADYPDLKDKFLQLSLWSNERIEACPKCRCLLMMDERAAITKMGQCPACTNVFCTDCKCDLHIGMTCEDALKSKSASLESLDENAVHRPLLELPAALRPDDSAPSRRPMRSMSVKTFEKNMQSAGCKVCPRCGAGVEKADDGCDHMICSQCHHHFCWTCLADRTAIFAHGNHHHRPGCKFHASYNGPDVFLPDKCRACKIAGCVCRAPIGKTAIPGDQYSSSSGSSVLLDAIGKWWNEGLFNATCTNSAADRRRVKGNMLDPLGHGGSLDSNEMVFR